MRTNRKLRHMSPADYVFGLSVAEAMTLARISTWAADHSFTRADFIAQTGAPPGLLTKWQRDGLLQKRGGQFMVTEAGRVAARTASGAVRSNPSFGHSGGGLDREVDDFEPRGRGYGGYDDTYDSHGYGSRRGGRW